MNLPNGVEFPQYDDEYMMFGMMFLLGNKLQVVGDSFFEEITSKQWFVLVMLEVFGKNPPTLNELSETMGSSHQNTKQLVLKLEKKGYIKTYTDPYDKRKIRITVTKECNNLFQKYSKKQQEFMKSIFQGIDKEDIKTTVKTLMHFENNLEGMKNGEYRNL